MWLEDIVPDTQEEKHTKMFSHVAYKNNKNHRMTFSERTDLSTARQWHNEIPYNENR